MSERVICLLGGKPKSSNPQYVIWPPLLFSLTLWSHICILLLQRAHEIHARNSKHVVTTCIHLSGISSECGIHNLKSGKTAGALSTRRVVCAIILFLVLFFFCFIAPASFRTF